MAVDVNLSGPQEHSSIFGQVLSWSDSRIYLPVGEVETTADTRVLISETALQSPDFIETRTDGIRHGDLIWAVGPRDAAGLITAKVIWAGVLPFPVVAGASTGTVLALTPRGPDIPELHDSITAVVPADTVTRQAWGPPTPGVPDSIDGAHAIAIGIPNPGMKNVELAALLLV